jgi:hypothetical protein
MIRLIEARFNTSVTVWEISSSSIADGEIESLLLRSGLKLERKQLSILSRQGERMEVTALMINDGQVKFLMTIRKISSETLHVDKYSFNPKSDSPELIVPVGLEVMLPVNLRLLVGLLLDDVREVFLNSKDSLGPRWVAKLLQLAATWSTDALENVVSIALFEYSLLNRSAIQQLRFRNAIDQRVQINAGTVQSRDIDQVLNGVPSLKLVKLPEHSTSKAWQWIKVVLAKGWQENTASLAELAARTGNVLLPPTYGLKFANDPEVDFEEFLDLVNTRPPENFTIDRRISNQSAFKVVYRGRDQRGNAVAIKRYKDWESERMRTLAADLGMSKEDVLRKDTLADWLGRVRHRNIVPSTLVLNPAGEPFLIEPLLDEIPDPHEQRSLVDIIVLVRGACAGLAYLHELQIIHSDIKPDNIGVLHGDPVLLDFGIASFLGPDRSGRDNPGSIKTRAPELFGVAVRPTFASDVWAMGATLMAFASGGEYPLLTAQEVRELPPAGDPRRREIVELIRARIISYSGDQALLTRRIEAAMPLGLRDLTPIIAYTCTITPEGRPSAMVLGSILDNLLDGRVVLPEVKIENRP